MFPKPRRIAMRNPMPSHPFQLLATLALLLSCATNYVHAQESTPWPPISPPTAPVAGASEAAPAAEKEGWLMTTPFANVSWPEIKMPRIAWKSAPDAEGQPGFFAGQMNKVRTASRGFAQRTKTAWNKTVDKIKITGGKRSGEQKPGFFARLFGPDTSQTGPQTVPEFLAQDRPSTKRR